MQLNITGHHIDVTASMRDYIESKFERIERHFDHVSNVHVILTVEKERQKAEATLHANRANLFAESEQGDMYASIDTLVDKLDRQIVKHKEKLTNHHRGENSMKTAL